MLWNLSYGREDEGAAFTIWVKNYNNWQFVTSISCSLPSPCLADATSHRQHSVSPSVQGGVYPPQLPPPKPQRCWQTTWAQLCYCWGKLGPSLWHTAHVTKGHHQKGSSFFRDPTESQARSSGFLLFSKRLAGTRVLLLNQPTQFKDLSD